MSKILWNSLIASPAILGAALAISSASAVAAETNVAQLGVEPEAKLATPSAIDLKQPEAVLNNSLALATNESALSGQPAELSASAPASIPNVEVPAQVAQTPVESQVPAANTNEDSSGVLRQLNRYSNEGAVNNSSAGQVTSVSQLSDVQPTDWAFQALQNLVERYGCIAGYPDGTFRGNRAMTRYEFAAGLNACLEAITGLIPGGDYVTREDLATLNRLLEEFQAELATLRGRVDALEARTAELEANQFSTTTKLVGEVIMAGTDSIGETGDVPAFQQRVRLNLNTSFTGDDLLVTRLQVGNAEPLSVLNNSREGTQTFNVFGDTDNQFTLDTLEYFFPFGDRLDLVVAANAGVWEDFTPTLNPYMEDFDGGNGSLSAFGQRNPIYRLGGGQGVGANIRFGRTNIFNVLKPSSLTLGYLASEGSDPSPGAGIYDGNYSALAQLNFTVGGISMAATYVHSYFGEGDFGFDNGLNSGVGNPGGFVGTNVVNSLNGLAETNPVVANSYGLEASLQVSPRFGLSGWVGYTDVILLRGANSAGRGDGKIWNYAVTLAFPDLGKEGNLLGIVLGAQPYLKEIENSAADFDSDGDGIPWHIEAFYKYQVTDNISVTPGVIWLLNPNQNEDSDDVVVGTVRGTFTF